MILVRLLKLTSLLKLAATLIGTSNSPHECRPPQILDSGMSRIGGRLTSDPNRSSLGLLPSGPDPVGEWLVHRQPPDPYIDRARRESKRRRCGHSTAGGAGSDRAYDPKQT